MMERKRAQHVGPHREHSVRRYSLGNKVLKKDRVERL